MNASIVPQMKNPTQTNLKSRWFKKRPMFGYPWVTKSIIQKIIADAKPKFNIHQKTKSVFECLHEKLFTELGFTVE